MTTLSPHRYALYIHVPFCRQMCTYCHFNTYAGLENLFQSYTHALAQEIRLMGAFRGRPAVKTLFLGGGTPTILSLPQLEHILSACFEAFNVDPQAEITSEANPGTLDTAYLQGLRALGVNRLSFGAQSFNPTELQMMNRLHNAEAIPQTVKIARQAGFDNLSFDLIFGLPHQTLDTWRHTLEESLALGTDHISLYGLTLERGTAMRAQVVRGDLPDPDPDVAAEMYELADSLMTTAGLPQYEISNWGKPGFESRHNLTYWLNQPYLGFGPGAHSFEPDLAGNAPPRRWWNVRPVPSYLKRLQALSEAAHPHPSLADFEVIPPALEMGETMMMGLRLTQRGVSLPEFQARFGRSVGEVYGKQLKKLQALNLLYVDVEKQSLKLTPSARLLGNRVFMEFLPD
jgi:oxygen-independent coproporphyrinogen-3 oxidase